MRKAVVAAVAAIAVASGAMMTRASAADLDYMAPLPNFQATWEGFYVGGHLGFGEAELEGRADALYVDDLDADLDASVSFRDSLIPDGLVGGAQAGYNWQFSSLVLGLEGDISIADWSRTTTVFDEPLDGFGVAADAIGRATAQIDMLASVRGRLGMAFDNILVYGTGGVAWADAEVRGRLIIDDGVDAETVWTGRKSFSDIGFVAGGGLAWMVIPQTLSVGIEGLYYFFDQDKTLDDATYDVGTGDLTVQATATLDDAWVVRGRADFHF